MAGSRIINLNDTTPAPTTGNQNVTWQMGPSSGTDPLTGEPIYPVSAQIPSIAGLATKSGVQQQSYTYAADTGAANAYAVTLSPAPSIVAGSVVVFKAANSNSGASTLAVNGGTAKAIKKQVSVSLASGDITAGEMTVVMFDGTNWQLQVPGSGPFGYPTTGAASVAQSSTPPTLNLTTEGTYDWIAPPTYEGIPISKAWGPSNFKVLGGWLQRSFCWTSGPSLFTYTSATPTLTSAASDDSSTALTGFSTGVGITAGSNLGVGFFFCVPADSYQRVLRIYCGVFSGVVTLNAVASDSSFSALTGTLTASAGAGASTVFKITYNAARDGQWLNVSVRLTTNSGSNPNVTCQAVTLAAS